METVRFDQLDLYPQVLRAIAEMGFEEATPIQSQAIPVVMSGVDVIGQAQTGTGKTASFGIPVLHKVDPNNKKTQVIILSPTRELAIQVADEIRKLAKYMHGVKILPVYGGQEISRQIKALKGGAQIIIGTPGRVMVSSIPFNMTLPDVGSSSVPRIFIRVVLPEPERPFKMVSFPAGMERLIFFNAVNSPPAPLNTRVRFVTFIASSILIPPQVSVLL